MPADKYPNFYENQSEVEKRLTNTIVMYDGEPYYVLCCADGKDDGILRLYLDSLDQKGGPTHRRVHTPCNWIDDGHITRAKKMDAWMKEYPEEKIIRKMMNSPHFNKFRPFPLGMVNMSGGVMYTARTPQRHTQQGLTQNMINTTVHYAGPNPVVSKWKIPKPDANMMWTLGFYDMLKGTYPTADECLQQLTDSTCINSGAAFHREFCLVRSTVPGTLHLGYKNDVVGTLPTTSVECLYLPPEHYHLREMIDELGIFKDFKTY